MPIESKRILDLCVEERLYSNCVASLLYNRPKGMEVMKEDDYIKLLPIQRTILNAQHILTMTNMGMMSFATVLKLDYKDLEEWRNKAVLYYKSDINDQEELKYRKLIELCKKENLANYGILKVCLITRLIKEDEYLVLTPQQRKILDTVITYVCDGVLTLEEAITLTEAEEAQTLKNPIVEEGLYNKEITILELYVLINNPLEVLLEVAKKAGFQYILAKTSMASSVHEVEASMEVKQSSKSSSLNKNNREVFAEKEKNSYANLNTLISTESVSRLHKGLSKEK